MVVILKVYPSRNQQLWFRDSSVFVRDKQTDLKQMDRQIEARMYMWTDGNRERMTVRWSDSNGIKNCSEIILLVIC